jgi:hypothetical protein
MAQSGVLFGATAGPCSSELFLKSCTSSLYILNPATGAVVSVVGPIGFAVTGLAVHPATGVLYGSTSRASLNSPGSLIRIDKTTGAGTVIGGFGIGTQSMADLTFTSDGTLYGWLEPSADDLHTINLTTGAATSVGNSGLSTSGSGLAAGPGDVLYFTGDGSDGTLRTVNRTTGITTVVANLTGSPPPDDSIGALAFSPGGALYGVHIDTDENTSRLITINPATGAITLVGATVNDLDAIVFDGSLAPPPPPSTLPVPALSPAVLVLLGLLVAGAAGFGLRRRS